MIISFLQVVKVLIVRGLQIQPHLLATTMATFSATVSLLSFLFSSLLLQEAQTRDVPIPSYAINLDLPPAERWKQVAIDYSQNLKELMSFFKESIGNNSYPLLSIMAASLHQYLPEEYAQEMMGFVTYGDISVGDIVIWNMLDELTAYTHQQYSPSPSPSSSSSFFSHTRGACTSIVAATASGKILHGRNLDYGGPLRKLAVTVHYQRDGSTVYSGTTFAGYVGLMTGVKPGHFTVSQNDRYNGDWTLNAQQASILGTKSFFAFTVRDLLADPNADFDSVVDTISNTQFIAPFYAIVGGVSGNEGAVITHNRSNAIDVWRLDDTNGRWFILETNYDHWMPPPDRDNRRDPANYMMNTTGLADINNDTMYTVLSTPPVLNDGTIFTVIMSAADPDLYNAYIRELS